MSSPIWFKPYTLADLKTRPGQASSMVEHVGIEFTEIAPGHLEARMPVDARTRQVYGILHGGASVVLAETLGSVAGLMCVDAEAFQVFGLEINANHLRPVSQGWVVGRAAPIHVGRTSQVWEIRIREEATGKAVCISRLTLAVRPKSG